MESKQEQGGSEPSKAAVGDAAHIAERHVVVFTFALCFGALSLGYP